MRAGPADEQAKFSLEPLDQHLLHQRTLARAGHTGDTDPGAERNVDVDVLQIVLACAQD